MSAGIKGQTGLVRKGTDIANTGTDPDFGDAARNGEGVAGMKNGE